MNQRGALQEIILILALALIGSAMLFSQTSFETKTHTSQITAETLELELQASQARFVVDKAASFLMQSAIKTNLCVIPSDFKAGLQSGFNSALSAAFTPASNQLCEAEILTGNVTDNTLFEVQVQCRTQDKRLQTKTIYHTYTLQKDAVITSMSPCKVQVTDVQSGQTEYLDPI